MTDILVPADPADLIDRIIALQLQIDAMPENPARAELISKQALLTRLAARVMPADDTMSDLTKQLCLARHDMMHLKQDLLACDARKDYGTAFVALAQALLTAMMAVDDARAAINRRADTVSARPTQQQTT